MPVSFETALRRALRPMVMQVRATLPKITTPAEARALGAALRKAWPDKRIAAIVAGIGAKAEAAASKPWLPLVRARARVAARRDAAEFDGEALLEKWSRSATKRITSLRDEVAEGLRAEIIEAAASGTPHTELAARWVARGVPVEFGTLEGRMQVIAQNQVATLNADVQRTRAGSVGVTHFEWVHSDQTVDQGARPEHVARNGLVFPYTFADLPGYQPNCNCSMVSVIPDDMVAELGLGSMFAR